MAAGDRSALVGKFAALAAQRVLRLGNLVVRLEQGGDRGEDGRDAQRELHTLKGEARILGLARTAAIAHGVENVLHAALAETPFPADAGRRILLGLDRLGAAISAIDGVTEPEVDVDAIVREIGGGDAIGPGGSETAAAPPAAPEAIANAGPKTAARPLDTEQIDELARLLGELRVLHTRWRAVGSTLRAIDDRLSRRGAQRSLVIAGDPSAGTQGSDEEIRGLARDGYAAAKAQLFEHESLLERLDQLTWSLRVVPIDQELARHPRAVRDLAVALGKKVRLDIDELGARVERPVLAVLDEITVHLLRNAVDHGIEPPDERARAGKSEVGRVALAVRPLGAHVELTVEDDGCGVDPDELRRAAVHARALSPEAAAAASDDEMLELLFAPGFTTRSEVSDVSGRGVGLDVVRDRAGSIGGTVTIESAVGRGTKVRALLPARVTMTRMLLVSSAGARIAIPAQSVRAVMSLARSDVESAADALFVRLDGEPVPLLDLAASMGEDRDDVLPDPIPAIVVAQPRGDRVFSVDRVVGSREAVQVPPGRLLEYHAFLRSIALLDDGEVALAIDCSALDGRRVPAWRLTGRSAPGEARTRTSVLLVDDSEVTRDVIGESLRDAGYDVAEAVDGRQALERMAASRPNLVITDLQMPVMDGFALVRAIREDARWKDLPVIVVSTLGAEADRQQAARAGADAYVVKSDLGRGVLLGVVSRFARASSPDGAPIGPESRRPRAPDGAARGPRGPA